MKFFIGIIGFLILFYSCNPVTERLLNFEVHGIDISHHQSRINWTEVSEQDIQFAFIKATEGESYVDSIFGINWKESSDAGIKRGAYHFFRPNSAADIQAKNFISTVNLQIGDLPPVLDVEVLGDVSSEVLVQRIGQWLKIVEDRYQIKPIIYTNLEFYYKHLKHEFDEYPMWIARYNDEAPQLKIGKEWSFWQYGNRGQVNGISGSVDLNVFNGRMEDLEDICIKSNKTISFLDSSLVVK